MQDRCVSFFWVFYNASCEVEQNGRVASRAMRLGRAGRESGPAETRRDSERERHGNERTRARLNARERRESIFVHTE